MEKAFRRSGNACWISSVIFCASWFFPGIIGLRMLALGLIIMLGGLFYVLWVASNKP